MRRLVVVGGGGFGREVLEIIWAINRRSPTWQVVGVVDDDDAPERKAAVEALGSRLIGRVSDLPATDSAAVIAIGSPAVRARIDRTFPSVEWASLIHPDTSLGRDVRLGPGTIVASGSRLSTAIRAGRHLHVDQNATVGHDVTMGDCVRLNPQSCVSGTVTIGSQALIGASAVILDGRTIGPGAVIGAGAVVTHDVAQGSVVKGVPAR